MAEYIENVLEQTSKLDWAFPFQRTGAFPIDRSILFSSLADAEAYARGDGSDERELGGTSYVGQVISVYEAANEEEGTAASANAYIITPARGLLKLASTTASGDVSADIADLQGKVSGILGSIDALEEAIGDVYTKEEADEKFAPVGNYAAQADLDALSDKIGEVEEDKTVVEMISEAVAAGAYNDTQVKADIKANADAIDAIEADYLKVADKYDDTVLAGRVSDAEGKIEALEGKAHEHANQGVLDAITAEKVTAWDAAEQNAVDRVLGYLAEEEVNVNYDTLKEVAAWIESDTTASAQLVTRISDIEKDYLKGADKEELENEIAVLGDYVGDIPEGAVSETVVAYIQEVVDGLKIGDYAKASELTALADRVLVVEGKAHEHENADVLDGITAEKVAAWDAAEQNAKDYADGLDLAMGERVDGIEEALEGKVGVEDGKSLIANALIGKLEGIAEGAQVNVIDSVDEAQFAIDDEKKLTLLDIAIGKVAGLQGALDAKADKGTTLAEYGITDAYTKTETESRIQEVLDGLSDTSETAASVAQALETYKTSNDQRVAAVETEVAKKVAAEEGKSLIADTLIEKIEAIEAGAQVNKLEGIKLGDTLLEIVDKMVTIPVGAGLKASAEVTIAADGTLGVGEVNVNKLVQTAGEVFILNGGAASV